MSLKTQIKTLLLETLQEDVEIDIPYAVEFNRHYLETLQRCLKIIQALIHLENLTQEDIDAAPIDQTIRNSQFAIRN